MPASGEACAMFVGRCLLTSRTLLFSGFPSLSRGRQSRKCQPRRARSTDQANARGRRASGCSRWCFHFPGLPALRVIVAYEVGRLSINHEVDPSVVLLLGIVPVSHQSLFSPSNIVTQSSFLRPGALQGVSRTAGPMTPSRGSQQSARGSRLCGLLLPGWKVK